MDWTKAKSLMIIALLLTNIMLVSVYFFQQSRNDIAQDSVTRNTISLLESKNIYVESDIPEQKKRMPVLSVVRSEIDHDTINNEIKDQDGIKKKNPDDQDYEEYCKKFLDNYDLSHEYMKLADVKKDTNGTVSVSFETVFEEFYIEKSWLTCKLADGKITEVSGKWYKPVKFGDTKKRTMTASNAMIKFMSQIEEQSKTSGIPHGKITVHQIELVYWLNEYSLGEGVSVSDDTAFPAWKISYDGDQESYIEAYEQ